MKNLKFLSLLLLLGLFITSCQRDEIEEDFEIKNQSEVQLRSYNQEDCGFINSFCEKQSNILVAFHELEPFEPCPNPPCFTGGGDDGSSMRILPVKIFDGTTAVYLEENNEAYFVIDTEHPAFEGKTIERTIPNGIRALLDIEYRDISDGTKLLEDIQNSTRININSTSNGTFNITSIDDGGGTISALIRYCDYRRVSEVESFIEVFFDGTNDPPSFVRGFIEDAFENAENNPDCIIEGSTGSGYSKCYYDCIDPRCVIDYLLDIDAGLSDDRKNIMIAQYLGEALGLSTEEIDFLSLSSNSTITSDVYSYLDNESDFDECEEGHCIVGKSASTLIKLANSDILNLDFDDPTFLDIIEEEFGEECVSPVFSAMLAAQVAVEKVLLQTENPHWSADKVKRVAFMNVLGRMMLEKLHLTLDIAGLVPGFGEVADITNGVIYTIEGKGIEAGLSFSAAIPFAGWASTGAKFAYKTVNTVSGAKTTLKIIIDDAGKATFGNRSQLRKMLGLCKGDGKHAHHIFSWVAGGSHDLVQFAAKKYGFHLNEIANGIGVAAWRNQPNHNLYDGKIKGLLDNLKNSLETAYGSLDNVPQSELLTKMKNLQDCIKNIIISNPDLHLNDLNLNC